MLGFYFVRILWKKYIKRNILIFKFGSLTLIFKLRFREERKILYKNKEICIKIYLDLPYYWDQNCTFKININSQLKMNSNELGIKKENKNKRKRGWWNSCWAQTRSGGPYTRLLHASPPRLCADGCAPLGSLSPTQVPSRLTGMRASLSAPSSPPESRVAWPPSPRAQWLGRDTLVACLDLGIWIPRRIPPTQLPLHFP
jgi:hypothetical protein